MTIPSLGSPAIWDAIEASRQAFFKDVLSGQVAERYKGG